MSGEGIKSEVDGDEEVFEDGEIILEDEELIL